MPNVPICTSLPPRPAPILRPLPRIDSAEARNELKNPRTSRSEAIGVFANCGVLLCRAVSAGGLGPLRPQNQSHCECCIALAWKSI